MIGPRVLSNFFIFAKKVSTKGPQILRNTTVLSFFVCLKVDILKYLFKVCAQCSKKSTILVNWPLWQSPIP